MLYVVTALDAEGPIDDPRKLEILSTWKRVDNLVKRLFSTEFRTAVIDSADKGPVLSWFILTMTGFKNNPFNRPMGYHQVYDHYLEQFGDMMVRNGDGCYWHYHHPARSGIANEWTSDWLHTNEYDNILARLLIEREFFPSCFRAGGRIETNDTSWWLEDIIPFDYSCCSGEVNWDNIESDGKPLRAVCDWSSAPSDWSFYHPAAEDYQRPGSFKRFVFRCPDLASSVHTLSDREIHKAFKRSRAGQTTALAFFEHDRRDSVFDKILDVYGRIDSISRHYPEVRWRFANAHNAAVAAAGLKSTPPPSFELKETLDNRIRIKAHTPLFGSMPFVAAGCKSGATCRRIGLVVAGRRCWLTDPLDPELNRIGVAAAGPSGKICTHITKRHLIDKV